MIIKMSAIQDIGNSTEKSYFPTKEPARHAIEIDFHKRYVIGEKIASIQEAHISE